MVTQQCKSALTISSDQNTNGGRWDFRADASIYTCAATAPNTPNAITYRCPFVHLVVTSITKHHAESRRAWRKQKTEISNASTLQLSRERKDWIAIMQRHNKHHKSVASQSRSIKMQTRSTELSKRNELNQHMSIQICARAIMHRYVKRHEV